MNRSALNSKDLSGGVIPMCLGKSPDRSKNMSVYSHGPPQPGSMSANTSTQLVASSNLVNYNGSTMPSRSGAYTTAMTTGKSPYLGGVATGAPSQNLIGGNSSNLGTDTSISSKKRGVER